MRTTRMTLDEALRPLVMACAGCGGKLVVYPDSDKGIGVCPACSPAWLEKFAQHCTNQKRRKHGLEPIEFEEPDLTREER